MLPLEPAYMEYDLESGLLSQESETYSDMQRRYIFISLVIGL